VTVPADEVPPITPVGDTVTDDSAAPGGLTVKTAVFVTPEETPLIVT
jgi:hypothetical protein